MMHMSSQVWYDQT